MSQVIYIIIIFVLYSTFDSNAQLLLQDDFQSKKDHWFWREDGNQKIPSIENGLLHLELINAIDSEYCNTEIYNPTEPYTAGTQARVRLKASEIHHGSRGWGFWDGHLNITALLFDYDVAWVMQQGSNFVEDNYNWFLFGVDGDTLTNRQTHDLSNSVDETLWHTYKINWESDRVSLFIDDNPIYETTKHIPDEEMRMDIWIDNRVIDLINPLEQWHTNAENSEMFVDFVEVTGLDGPSIDRNIEGNILLWDSPNTFPNGEKEVLWKEYNFNSQTDGEALIFITGSAENLSNEEDDDLRIEIDGNDFGWNTDRSLNGADLYGSSKSIVIPLELSSGNHSLKLFSDTTPFLRDVIVLHSPDGKTIFEKHYNETISIEDGLWKIIEFRNDITNNISILISGLADKNSGLRFEIDDKDFGWEDDTSINGGYLKGLPNTVAINQDLESGTHQLKIYSKGNPTLLSVAIYAGETITDIKSIKSIPNEISLSANPNPFNATTNIKYITTTDSHNKLRIINLLGEETSILIDQYQKSGNYSINWIATNVPSGIYFCILESNNYFKVQKLVLLK